MLFEGRHDSVKMHSRNLNIPTKMKHRHVIIERGELKENHTNPNPNEGKKKNRENKANKVEDTKLK